MLGHGPCSRRFNSRDPCGSRQCCSVVCATRGRFQLTRPVRVATKKQKGSPRYKLFQLTRPVRVATQIDVSDMVLKKFQLTRPVRVATSPSTKYGSTVIGFNSRDPCGSRQPVASTPICTTLFQLTRPVRVATKSRPCRECHQHVSTHATRAGRDCKSLQLGLICYRFQLTRPVRVATF